MAELTYIGHGVGLVFVVVVMFVSPVLCTYLLKVASMHCHSSPRTHSRARMMWRLMGSDALAAATDPQGSVANEM